MYNIHKKEEIQLKKLIASVTWVFEREIDDEVFREWAEDGYDEEYVKRSEEDFIYDEYIHRIEGRIDNICSEWRRENVTMNWEED